MDINHIVNSLNESEAKSALINFLQQYLSPAFGALPKNEVELIVLDILEQVRATESNPEVYELVSKLKVTRSKARGLIYARELRKSSENDLNEKVKSILKKPLLQKNGDLFVLEVENPLVSDHIRSKVQKLGYVSDGSFSPNIVKLSLDAVTALIASFLSKDDQNEVKAALIAAGAPDSSFQGVLKATFKKVANKVASDAGEALLEKASEIISPIIDASIETIQKNTVGLFD